MEESAEKAMLAESQPKNPDIADCNISRLSNMDESASKAMLEESQQLIVLTKPSSV